MKKKVNKRKNAIMLFFIVGVFICGYALAVLLGAPNIFTTKGEVNNKEVELKGKETVSLADEEAIEVKTEEKNEEETEVKTEVKNKVKNEVKNEVKVEKSDAEIKNTKEEKKVNKELSKTDKIFKELISEYEGKTYDDSWHKYDIKSVESVKTELVQKNAANNAELYKCDLTYKTSAGKSEKAELAMIIDLDSNDQQLVGTYENFTGSTRYTKFVGLYQEPDTELSKTDKIFKELISEYEGKTYDDSWHEYDIKSVESVKTELVQKNAANNAELYKCDLTYKTSAGKLEKAELAMIIDLESNDKQLVGTYENFTGSTRYTKFIGLYQEPSSEDASSSNE